MQKLSIVFIVCVIAFTSCLKDSDRNCSAINVVATASEVDSLRNYLEINGIDATEDSRGFFYTITAPGDQKPSICNTITFTYTGRFMDGTQFDTGNNVVYPLSNLILGWQEGIPLIGNGGSITLYIPPSLGYGSSDYGSIPGNSYLIFNIGLNGIN